MMREGNLWGTELAWPWSRSLQLANCEPFLRGSSTACPQGKPASRTQWVPFCWFFSSLISYCRRGWTKRGSNVNGGPGTWGQMTWWWWSPASPHHPLCLCCHFLPCAYIAPAQETVQFRTIRDPGWAGEPISWCFQVTNMNPITPSSQWRWWEMATLP